MSEKTSETARCDDDGEYLADVISLSDGEDKPSTVETGGDVECEQSLIDYGAASETIWSMEEELVVDVASDWHKKFQTRLIGPDDANLPDINLVNEALLALRPILQRELKVNFDYLRHLYVSIEYLRSNPAEYERLIQGIGYIAKVDLHKKRDGNGMKVISWLKSYVDNIFACPMSPGNGAEDLPSIWNLEVQRRKVASDDVSCQGSTEAHRFIETNTKLGAVATNDVIGLTQSA